MNYIVFFMLKDFLEYEMVHVCSRNVKFFFLNYANEIVTIKLKKGNWISNYKVFYSISFLKNK